MAGRIFGRVPSYLFGNDRPDRYLFLLLFLGFLLLGLAIIQVAIQVSSYDSITQAIIGVVLYGGPSVGIVLIAYLSSVHSIDEDLYRTILGWTAGVAIILIIAAQFVIYHFGSHPTATEALYIHHISFAIGAFAGGITGFYHARAITQARNATASKEQRNQLKYLNHLLRHDLNNNLSIIHGNAELALEEADEEIADRLDTIRHQSGEAKDLIKQVGILIQTPRKDISLEPVNVSDIIEGNVAKLRDTYPEAEIHVDLTNDVVVHADSLIKSVFENLLRNAIIHNDSPHPEVSIELETTTEYADYFITDNGPGIPPEIREDIFESPNTGEHGFGLYIVETLVNRYNGSVSITESGPEGTTFRVRLPKG